MTWVTSEAPEQQNVTPAEGKPEVEDKALPVSLDLDSLEREGAVAEKFRFTHQGTTYEMFDPQDIDWQDLLAGLRNPGLFVRFAMSTADQVTFFSSRVPAWKMNKLMEAYQKHFGLPDLGNANALRD
jgi:hypothetical protein